MGDADLKPYSVERAKQGRAKCKKCKNACEVCKIIEISQNYEIQYIFFRKENSGLPKFFLIHTLAMVP